MPALVVNAWGCREGRGTTMGLKSRWFWWALAVLLGITFIIGGLWVWRERSARTYEEQMRQQVEEQLYREGELGHPPGQLPTSPQR